MRFNNILYQKIRFAGLLIIIALLSWPVTGQVQREKKTRQLFDVVLKLVDENGAPVPGASVVVGEGITHAVTDNNGSVTFKGYPEDVVTITAFQFDKKVVPVIDIVNANTVTLERGKIHMTSGDVVTLPFTTLKKRNLTGPEVSVPGSWFSRYPSTDLRNSLTGISSMIDVREADGSPGMSPLEGLQNYSNLTVSSFGATDKFNGMPYVLVDNMPVDLQELIVDPSEIESATLVKGILGTMMYGPAATGGILLIKTKQGVRNERMLHVDIENGVSFIDRMPGYVKGDVYATLQNQARTADGLPAAYSSAAIAAFKVNDGYDLTYPNTDFRDMMLDNTMEFRRVNMSSSGGNDIVQYYSYLGYAGEGDIIDMGAKSDYNRITTRQNVNVKINDHISAAFGFYGNLTFRRSPSYGYDSDLSEGTGNSTLGITEIPAILDDTRNTPPVAYPIWAFYDTTTVPATPWYGITSIYTNNLIGNLVDQGFYTDKGRTGVSNIKLTYDAANILPGLKSESYFGFNIHNTVRIGKSNDYLAYTVNVSPTDTVLTRQSSHSLSKMADLYKLMDYYFQRYMFYERLSFERSFGSSSIQASAMYHQTMSYINGIEEPQRQRSILGTLSYNLQDKYELQGVLNYAGNSSFAKDYRQFLNWSAGAAWIISDENFMPQTDFLNYLKLRAQGGVAGNETYFPNLYDIDRWSSTSTTSTSTPYGFGALYTSVTRWFGNGTEAAVNRSYLGRTANPQLTWEKRKEVNAGLDAVLMNEKFGLSINYYNWLVDGSIAQTTSNMPYIAGYNGTRPYQNFAQTRYYAVTADLAFTQRVGELMISIGANATHSQGKRIKYDEPQYRNDYQLRTGKSSDAIFGYSYLGKFASDAIAQGANNTPLQLFDEKLKAGDLQYADLNKDGFVDDSDQGVIGNSSPDLYYGLNIALKYKNLDLFVLGAGRAFYDVVLNNAYYWNGWGDNNYSEFVADNIGGAYPRLTYYRVNNNFVTSDFWLKKGGYFKIQNVELAYTIPSNLLQFMGGRSIKIYVRGANLLTLSEMKDVDPESINSGVEVYPLFRTFSGGIKFNF